VLLSVAFGQAGLSANAGGPSLSMGQSRSGSGSAVVGGGSSSVSTDRTTAAAGSLTVDLDQWANKPGQGWQNGDLNKNNSAYHEGDVVPFRLAMEGLSDGSHTIHLNYDFTAGGHEAYDFLASYDVTENPGLCASGGGAVSSMCPSLPAPDSHAFPGDSFSPGPPTHSGLTVNGAIAAAAISRNLLLYGGTITNIAAPTHSGPTNNNSSGDMVVTFTTSGGSALFAWGAHIASSDYWVTGTGDANGAAAVSGAPWHMRTQALDDSGNKNQDRSIQPSAIIKLVPAIAVTKTCPANATVGDTIQYTIEVSNTGADQLNDVTVTDPVLGGDLSGSFADTLAVGASESHDFPYTLTGSPDPVVNTVTVDAKGAQDATAVTDSADCTTDVLSPDLTITKTADAGQVNAGDDIGFTVTLTNGGDGAAYGVQINDPLPGGNGVDWSIDANDPAQSCSISGSAPSQTLSCGPLTLAAGHSLTVHVTSATDPTSCGDYDNTASFTSSNDGSGEASDSVTVNCPDVTITKTADAGQVNAGDDIGFTVTLTNGGDGAAYGVQINDPLPAGSGVSWSIDSNTPAQSCSITGSAPSQTLVCGPTTVLPGDSITVHVTSATDATSCGDYDNTASFTTTNDGSGNASDSVTVNCPDLTITKTADAGSVNAGDAIGFTVILTNGGAGDAYGVQINDPLPGGNGVDWSIDANDPAQSCSISGSAPSQTLSCGPLTLAAGHSLTVHVTSATDPTSCGDYDNTASFTSSNDGSGEASDSVTVNCPVGITLDKTTENGTTFHVGDTVQYAFLVALESPDDVPLGDVTLTDDTGICDSAPTFDSGDTNGNGLLEQGETWKFTCTHVVTGDDPSLIHNVATVQGTSADERTVTATDDQDVTVIHPAIKIVKTVDPQSGAPGDTVTYTYVVKNIGDTTLYDISVDDDVIGHIGEIAQLDPGDSVTLTKDFVLPAGSATVTNVGTATGTDVLGTQVSDDDDAFVTIVEAENPPPSNPPTAFTGSDAARLGLIAGLMLALGVLALVLGRRRHQA
jgi:uncharacterized repeat protein (TIGR01451 family)